MGREHFRSNLTFSAVARDDLGAVVEDIAEVVVSACKAEALLFQFSAQVWGDQLSGEQNVVAPSSMPRPDLLHALSDFCTNPSIAAHSAPENGISHCMDLNGTEFIFFKIGLGSAKEALGTLCLAISRDNWVAQHSFELCVQIARLASLNLATSTQRSKLELDVADLKQQTHRLTRAAETDGLTGVENRSSFELKARARLTDRTKPAALLILDLDHFKSVNDLYGHQFGDGYLTTIAEALRTTFPKSALIGRLGGDEFCVLVDLPETGKAYLSALLVHLRAAIQRNMAYFGKSDLGRVSVGVSLFPRQASTYETLFGHADTALYESKSRGRNTTTIYRSSLSSFAQPLERASESAALDLDHLVAHFQPIMDLEQGACRGLEVLARVSAGDKIVPVSLSGLDGVLRDDAKSRALTMRVVTQAVRDLSMLEEAMPTAGGNRPLDIWFNVTGFDLLNPEFVFDLQAIFSAHDIQWSRIVIEVSERITLGDPTGQVFRTLREIQQRGGRVALDDFGTGYAGLQHVRDWPVDIIKIDQSFIQNISRDPTTTVIVEALLRIAGSLSQSVVAEGIETQEQMSQVRSMGCLYGQGFLFARALPVAALSEWLQLSPETAQLPQGAPVPA